MDSKGKKNEKSRKTTPTQNVEINTTKKFYGQSCFKLKNTLRH